MRKTGGLLVFLLIALFMGASVASAAAPRSQQNAPSDSGEDHIIVGRISHVEGKLLRYVPEEKDWVATVKDAPFGLDDALYSDEDSKAEFIMPNGTWLRIDGSTQVQLIALKDEVSEIDVASGIARFINKSNDTVIKATTPFGYVAAEPGTVFDLYVGDESVEVISIKGSVDFVFENDQSKYTVEAGSSSVVADSRQVTSGEGNVDADWDDWNNQRDSLWAKRVQVKGESVQYLPEQLHDDAYELEENGSWETVQYEGEQRRMWRPTRVEADWAPFTQGRWSVYYEDQCWVPDEPFGYVTHHYGNWVVVNGGWYWAPPVVRVAVGAPVVGIGFGWYPGRVGWIHTGVEVGWVPLAPTEVYYSYHHWGPRAVVVTNMAAVNINIGGFRYVDRAVVVSQANLYSVNSYRGVRITNINRTVIVNNYRGAPVVNRTVINNYTTIRNRYNYNNNITVNRRPHETVVNRIQKNEVKYRQAERVNGRAITQEVNRVRPAQPTKVADVKSPRVTNKLVNPGDVNKPINQVATEKRDIKRNARSVNANAPVNQIVPQSRRAGGANGQERIRPPKAGDTQTGTGIERPQRPGREGRQGEVNQGGATERQGEQRIRPPRPGREGMTTGEQGKQDRLERRGGAESGSSVDQGKQDRLERRQRTDELKQPEGRQERLNRRGGEEPGASIDRRQDRLERRGGAESGSAIDQRKQDRLERRQRTDELKQPEGRQERLNRRGGEEPGASIDRRRQDRFDRRGGAESSASLDRRQDRLDRRQREFGASAEMRQNRMERPQRDPGMQRPERMQPRERPQQGPHGGGGQDNGKRNKKDQQVF